MSRTIVGPFDVTLHRVTQDWGEGTSDATGQEGTGIDSATGDATWTHAFSDSQAWSTPGGDFVSDSSASTSVDQNGFYTWTSEQLVADVQGWLDDPSSNAGWILLTDETQTSAKRFDSRENATEANRPQLVVEYETTSVAQNAQAVSNESGSESTDAYDIVFADSSSEPLPGDTNGDGSVSFGDFLVLSRNFGRTDAAFADGDFDGNRTVDFSDFLLLAQNFR